MEKRSSGEDDTVIRVPQSRSREYRDVIPRVASDFKVVTKDFKAHMYSHPSETLGNWF
jgi:hypothetical protein